MSCPVDGMTAFSVHVEDLSCERKLVRSLSLAVQPWARWQVGGSPDGVSTQVSGVPNLPLGNCKVKAEL